MRNIITRIVLLFAIAAGNAQPSAMSAMDVLKKAAAVYDKQPYMAYNSTYALYLDYTTTKPYEKYNGVFIKKDGASYLKIKNTEFIAFKKYGLKINHDDKAAIVKEGKPEDQSPLAPESYLKGFTGKLLASGKEFYVCELRPVKISQIMLHKIIIYVKKSDFSIAKQQLFLIEKMESKNAKGKTILTIPRLEIDFSPRPKNEVKDAAVVTQQNYLQNGSGGITLSKRFSKYTLYKS